MSSTEQPARSRTARVLSGLVHLVLVAATLAGLAYLAPALFGYERYVITGGSMSGTFEKYSVAFEKQVAVEDLAVGDVITYQPPADSGVTSLVTHRIVDADVSEAGARLFTTQGDANPDPDPWTFTLVEGTQPVVQHTVPLLGHVFVALADRDTRMLVIGAPAALIALASLVELAKALRPARPGGRRLSASGDPIVPAPPNAVVPDPVRGASAPMRPLVPVGVLDPEPLRG
ncbi:signal peptidase I [Aeromicrobium sp. CF4.19]|uniref:signal peptidase I n=1 Tax=Aeromicrobium sp. CF4.19 TaxID=3373082 RepID=UPI003EE425E4